MNKLRRLGLRLLVSVATMSLVNTLYAQSPATSRVKLRYGMTYSEVQALWGEPTEVVEQEVLHQSIWRYSALKNAPATTLRFVRGNLVKDTSKDLESKPHRPGEEQKANQESIDSSAKAKPPSFMALSDQEELNEILKDVPNEPEGGDKPGRNPPSAMPVPIE